ncbi:MAG: nickel pincer cofactor biosynthesis protein LarB [Pseudomonadota bacterium]
MTDIRLDWDRAARTGVPEAIFCETKTAEQIARIIDEGEGLGHPVLFTRLSPDLLTATGRGGKLDYDPTSRTAILGNPVAAPHDVGIALVCAGTSDLPVLKEAERTLIFCGVAASSYADVGVAGLWRLTETVPKLAGCKVVIAFAGFEAALFSVLAGLIAAPVIAVPTSIGSGVAAGGQAALTSALASCAPGVLVVNIDNGFGAACAALKILNATGTGPPKRGEMS